MGAALLRNQFSRFSGVGNGEQFPDPFLDVASLAVPGTMRNALFWCEYIYSMCGTYRMAMERVISYFITDIDLKDVSQDEKEKWDDFLRQTLDAGSVIQNMLRDRMCFHGDVKAITRGGVFKLRDLAGKTVDVLSKGGVYRPATFKSFGRQPLLEVKFSDGRKILATPEHEWYVKNCSGRDVKIPTTALRKGHRIERTVAARPEKNDDYYEGVRHGFTFGDGSLNGGDTSAAYFCGPKDEALLPYFSGHGNEPRRDSRGVLRIGGLPARYKRLPENERTASYWYGFVSGFLAADGSVDTYGCALLTQKAKATLEVVVEQLPRIGMVAGPVRGHWRTAEFLRSDGGVDAYAGFMHYVTLLKRFMRPDDFLIPAHRENFEKNYKPTEYGRYVSVKSVTETGIEDEVFCCVEMETHSFVVDQAVLTAQCYGNSFCSVVVPFKRFLVCPKCGSGYPLKVVADPANQSAFHFKWNLPDFLATCPNCKVGSGFSGKFKVDDKPDDEEKKIRVKRWNPHEIELLHDPYTDEAHYLWRIPEDYKQMVRKGNLFHLERAPKEVLNAIHKNQVFRFNPDTVYHMKEPTLAGILNRGWGIPRIISNFRQIWYVQVLHRFNEAIALDYVIPFRLITPGQKNGGGSGGAAAAQDPLLMFNGGDFRGQVQQMIRRRRRDPASWQILPFPVNYQMLGAEANQLAPRDLMDQGMETLLNDAGTPVELYKGSLQLQTAPVALRLFESTWHHLVHDSNALVQWLVEQIAQILSWEAVKAAFKRVTIADDIQKQMTALQLMMSQQLSGTSGLAALGYSWPQEQKQMAEEAREQAEIQARTQEEMEQAGFAQQIAKGQQPGAQPPGGDPSQGGGQPAPGGAGGGGGGAQDPSAMGGAAGTAMQGPVTQYIQSMSPSVPQSPQDMLAAADSIAQQLLGLPESVKDSELRKLKQANPVLHSLVRTQMDSTRQQAKNQASQGGGGQPAG